MLSKNRLGLELWSSTERLQKIIGGWVVRHKSGYDSRGRKLGPCEMVSRLTVQRWIDELERAGILVKIIPENTWVGQPGNRKFRHTPTYKFCRENVHRAQTEAEWVEKKREAKFRAQRASTAYGTHRNGHAKPSEIPSGASSPESPNPAQPAVSQQPPPAAAREIEDLGSRKQERVRNLRIRLGAKIAEFMEGVNHVQTLEGFFKKIEPGHVKYLAPLPRDVAILKACEALGITEAEGRELLKVDQPEVRR